jgi:hypothetical protein
MLGGPFEEWAQVGGRPYIDLKSAIKPAIDICIRGSRQPSGLLQVPHQASRG